MSEQEKTKTRGIDFPNDLFDWLRDSAKQSIRTFKGEVIYQLLKAKELESNAKVTNNNQ